MLYPLQNLFLIKLQYIKNQGDKDIFIPIIKTELFLTFNFNIECDGEYKHI